MHETARNQTALDAATLESLANFYAPFWVNAESLVPFDLVFRDLADAFRLLFGSVEVLAWIPEIDRAAAAAAKRISLTPAYSTHAPFAGCGIQDQLEVAASPALSAIQSGSPLRVTVEESGGLLPANIVMQAAPNSAVWLVPIPALIQRFGAVPTTSNQIIVLAAIVTPDGSPQLPAETIAFFARIAGKQIERALWKEQDLVVHEAFAALDTLQSDRYLALDAVADAIRRSLRFEACTILQADASRRVLTLLGTTGIDSRMSRRKMEYPYGFSLSGAIALEKQPLAIEDTRQSDKWGSTRLFPDIVEHADRYQYLGAPLVSAAGELLGVIRLRNKRPPEGCDGPFCLNALDKLRIERVAKIIAPLMALMIRETEMAGAMRRIQHDIDMPATAIRDGAGVLRRRLDSRILPDIAAAKQRFDNAEPLPRIASDVDQIHQKLEDIESFGEILLVNSVLMGIFDAEELSIAPQPVLLVRDLVAKLCKMLTPLAREKQLSGILYNQNSLFSIPALWLDSRLMEIALYNLLQNALKYSNPDTVVVIDGEVQRNDGRTWYVVNVRNQGIGVSDEDINRIFERYYRAPKARKRAVTGLGIGLSTARAIVERHGGKLLLTQKDNPTIFSIRLPESLATRRPD